MPENFTGTREPYTHTLRTHTGQNDSFCHCGSVMLTETQQSDEELLYSLLFLSTFNFVNVHEDIKIHLQ